MLAQGRNPIALNYVVYAWRELAASDADDVRRLLDQSWRQRVSRGGRRGGESLAHGNARVRLAALKILGRIAALKDVSLLNDLLALPPAGTNIPANGPQ